jgi:chorismate--pyruvate lyase
MAGALGSQPLGAALFADPSIQRGPLQVAHIAADHPLHRAAGQASHLELPGLWARRSLFCRAERPLLVTEVFLPGILGLPA